MDFSQYASAFRRDGYAICDDVVPMDVVENLRQGVADLPDRQEVRRKRSVYGIRNLLEICPQVRSLSIMPCVRQFATAVLGSQAFAVRAIFFDKVADANWSLFWHQDNVIAVQCGGVVAMCPLTLHASSPAQEVGHRRVIHIEYAAEELPGGLQWNNRVGQELQPSQPSQPMH